MQSAQAKNGICNGIYSTFEIIVRILSVAANSVNEIYFMNAYNVKLTN